MFEVAVLCVCVFNYLVFFSQVNDLESIDLSALEHKLDEVLPRSK